MSEAYDRRMGLTSPNLLEKAECIYRLLAELYGEPSWAPRYDPVSELVTTILSQNTSDVNQERAFRRLRERYPRWEDVVAAPVAQLIEVIRPAGLAEQRAPRIQQALRYILQERGGFELDFLRHIPLAEAKSWLTAIKGIGPKTAAIVLLFSLGRPAFPVDTHVHRLCLRLGLVPAKTSASKTQVLMEELVPQQGYFPFHMNLIAHGRRICKAQRPLCEECVITQLCDFYQTRLQPAQEGLAGPEPCAIIPPNAETRGPK